MDEKDMKIAWLEGQLKQVCLVSRMYESKLIALMGKEKFWEYSQYLVKILIAHDEAERTGNGRENEDEEE